MPDCEPRAVDVVGGDVADALAGDVEVDRDRRDTAFEQPGELRLTAVDAHQDQSVDPVVERAPQELLGPIGGEDQQVVAEIPGRVLQAGEDVLEERVPDVWVVVTGVQHDPQHLRAASDQGARGGAGDVVELGSLREHPLAGLVAHLRRPVEHARDRRDRHATPSRHVVDVRDRSTSSVGTRL